MREGVPVASATPNEYGAMTDMLAVADTEANSSTFGAWTPSIVPHKYPSEVNGMFGANGSCAVADIKDGASNTLAIGETTGAGLGTRVACLWASDNLGTTVDGINGFSTAVGGTYGGAGSGQWWALYYAGFASWHPGGCHFLLADGSVQFLSQNISQDVLRALTTRDGPGRGKTWNEIVVAGPP
jgi:prepilin-type processing-associated H-X9-DG protein